MKIVCVHNWYFWIKIIFSSRSAASKCWVVGGWNDTKKNRIKPAPLKSRRCRLNGINVICHRETNILYRRFIYDLESAGTNTEIIIKSTQICTCMTNSSITRSVYCIKTSKFAKNTRSLQIPFYNITKSYILKKEICVTVFIERAHYRRLITTRWE